MVGIIMGSQSDLPIMEQAATFLKSLDIPYELTVVSAHRTPERMFDYAKTAKERGLKVIIAGAGGAARRRVRRADLRCHAHCPIRRGGGGPPQGMLGGAPALHRIRNPGGRDARDRPLPGSREVLRPDLRLAEDEGRVH